MNQNNQNIFNFDDLTEREKENALYGMYVDLAFIDPVYSDGKMICPTLPLSSDCVGVPVFFYRGKSSWDINDFCCGIVTKQIGDNIEISCQGKHYVSMVWNVGALH